MSNDTLITGVPFFVVVVFGLIHAITAFALRNVRPASIVPVALTAVMSIGGSLLQNPWMIAASGAMTFAMVVGMSRLMGGSASVAKGV